MKKSILYAIMLCAPLFITGCAGEEDEIFGASALQRVEQAKIDYARKLESSKGGWLLQYYPINNDGDYKEKDAFKIRGYLMGLNFNADKTVTVGMNNVFSKKTYKEDVSCWDIVGDIGPVLTFNTYNECLHAFSSPEDITDPDIVGKDNLSLDEQGTGAEGDYEFVIVELPADGNYALLKGKKRSTYNYMTMLPENTNLEDYLKDVSDFSSKFFNTSCPNSVMMTDGTSKFEVRNMSSGISSLALFGADFDIASVKCPYLITKQGDDYVLRFRDVVAYEDADGNIVKTSARSFRYDQDKDVFTCIEDSRYVIMGYPAVTFFKESVEAERKFTLSLYSSMSDNMKQLFNNAYEEMRNAGFTLIKIDFTTNADDENVLRLTYSLQNEAVVNFRYILAFDEETDKIDMKFDTPLDNGQNIINAFPSVKNLLDVFSQQFAVSGEGTSFDYSNMRFTSTSDPETWFVLKYNY